MNKVNLIIDIGNTTIAIGAFDETNIVSSFVVNTHDKINKLFVKKLENFLCKFVIKDGMIFSVVPKLDLKIRNLIKKITGVELRLFDYKTYKYKKKDKRITDDIGADLIADLVGTEKLYGPAAIIFDLGTVNKLLLVNDKGVFIGASFTPGIELELCSFSSNTALLPKAKNLNDVTSEVGLSTIDCMKHGVYWSLINFVECQKKEQEKKLGYKLKLILTGGNSALVEKEFKDKIFDPFLTLKGMNAIFMEDIK